MRWGSGDRGGMIREGLGFVTWSAALISVFVFFAALPSSELVRASSNVGSAPSAILALFRLCALPFSGMSMGKVVSLMGLVADLFTGRGFGLNTAGVGVVSEEAEGRMPSVVASEAAPVVVAIAAFRGLPLGLGVTASSGCVPVLDEWLAAAVGSLGFGGRPLRFEGGLTGAC